MKAYTRIWVFIAAFFLVLGGCGKEKQKSLTVYSFSGENETIAVSNGVIILNGTEEIFSGGDLKVTGEGFTDITFYSSNFYIMSGDEKNRILSNAVEDITGGTVLVSGDLGKCSGASVLKRIKPDGNDTWKNNFYFEFTTRDKAGEETVYQLQMRVKEVTKNTLGKQV